MGRVTDTRHIGVPLFLVLCVISITIAVTPLWTAAQTPPATEQATSEGGAADTQAATGATVDTAGGATTEQGAAATGDSTDGTPSDNGAGNGGDALSPTVAPTDPPLTPTEPIVAPTPTLQLDTPTPTPTPALPNTDTLSATSDTAPAALQPGQTRQYTFTYNVTTPRTGTTIHAELRLDDGSPATGWLLQAQAGQGTLTGDGPAVDVAEATTVAPGGTFPLTMVAQAPKDVTAPQTVSLYLSSTATTENGEVENGILSESSVATLSVAPQPTPTPAMMNRMLIAPAAPTSPTISCNSSGTLTGGVEWDCTFSGVNKKENYQLYLGSLTTGWTYQFLNPAPPAWNAQSTSGWVTPGTLPTTVGPVFTFDGTTLATFTFAIGPGSTVVDNPAGTATLYFQNTNNAKTSNTQTLNATVAVPCTPSVSAGSLAFPDSTWSGGAYPAVSASMGLTISKGTGCSGYRSGWTIQVSTQGMTSSSGSIPSNALSYSGTASAPQGITPVNTSISLSSSSQTIATGSASVSDGAVWSAPFGLNPPTTAPPGTYSGTITITVGNGS